MQNSSSRVAKKKQHDIFNYLEQVHLAHTHTPQTEIETHTNTSTGKGKVRTKIVAYFAGCWVFK